MNNLEYRVRWQRQGKNKRIRICQTLKAAQEYVVTLKSEYFYRSSSYDAEEGIGVYEKIPDLLEDPIIESRPVGVWS